MPAHFKPSRRIVFVNRFAYPDHSATSQIVSDLAASLVQRGHVVSMVVSRQRYDDPLAALPAHEVWRGVDIHRVWSSRFGRGRLSGRAMDYLTFYTSLPFTLCPLLRSGDIVVAKTDPPLVALVVAVVAKLRRAKLVNWLQDVFPEVAVNLGKPRVPALLAWLLRGLRNAALRAASMNVAIGERMAEYVESEAPIANRVMVIPNWAHEDSIHPQSVESSEMRASLGWSGAYVIGYSGNLGRAHDVDTLLDAMHRLRGSTRISFLIIGGGHGYNRLRAECQHLPRVRFLPYQPLAKLSDSMAAADLHVVSLRPELEGQVVPSKFYGVAAAERPMAFIGDSDGEIARLIERADCGFTVRPGEGAELARRIQTLADAPQTGVEQGRRARLLLTQRFSRDAAQQQWHHLLLELGATPLHLSEATRIEQGRS
jgi:glycosyltransferase involved in cell wall biosynthesis